MAFDPSILQGILGKLGSKGQAAGGEGGGSSKLDVVNTALGLAGGLNFLTAKKPEISRPDTFTSVLPVQNYEADRNQGYNQVAHNASSAMNNVRSQMGADWAAYASAALGVNAQSNNAVNQINAGIGQQKRQDNIAAAQQLSADKEFNYTTQRSFDEAQYNEQMDAYRGQREQGAGMMQSSLNYMVGKDADNRAFVEKQKLAEQQIMGTALENQLRYSGSNSKDVLNTAAQSMPGVAKFMNAFQTPTASTPAVSAAPTLANYKAPTADELYGVTSKPGAMGAQRQGKYRFQMNLQSTQ